MAKRRSAQFAPVVAPSAHDDDHGLLRDNALAGLTDGRGELTFKQRVALIEAIDQFHFDAAIMAHCKEDDPTFPDLSRKTISGYRQRVKAGEFESYLKPLREERYRDLPLTSAQNRLTFLHWHMSRLLKQPLEAAIPIIDEDGCPLVDDDGKLVMKHSFNDKVSAEILKTLAAIQREGGVGSDINVNVSGTVNHQHVHVSTTPEVLTAAQTILDRLEIKDELMAALTSSERPDMTTINAMFEDE